MVTLDAGGDGGVAAAVDGGVARFLLAAVLRLRAATASNGSTVNRFEMAMGEISGSVTVQRRV